MSRNNIEQLTEAVSGEVAWPDDKGYDESRSLWNARFDRRPSVVIRCHNVRDVKAAVDVARDEQLQLSVKGGGHAYAANTVGEGSLLIDLSPMKDIAVNPNLKRVRVEPGVNWGELDQATQKYGLATTGSTVSTVGVAGYTLGGGTSHLVRKHGMAIDNLISVEIVTANGKILQANNEKNSDLFWALRGGGGNFGVVTAFEFQLHEVGPEVLAGQIVHRFEDTGDLLRFYRGFMAKAPEALQCYAFILRVPPIDVFPEEYHGQLALDFVVFHIDPAAKEELLPLLEFGDPFLSAVGPQPYTSVQQSFDAGLPAGQRYESRAHYLAGVTDEVIDTITTHASGLVGPFTVAYLEPLGGAVGRVDPTATAFAHRDASYSFHILAGWTDAGQDDEVLAWAKAFHEEMALHSTGGVYINLLGSGEQDRVRAAYGANYDRLVELKNKWDPENLFLSNHNIPPSPQVLVRHPQ